MINKEHADEILSLLNTHQELRHFICESLPEVGELRRDRDALRAQLAAERATAQAERERREAAECDRDAWEGSWRGLNSQHEELGRRLLEKVAQLASRDATIARLRAEIRKYLDVVDGDADMDAELHALELLEAAHAETEPKP